MAAKNKPQGVGTLHHLTPQPGRVEPEAGWTAKHSRGLLRFDATDAGRLVRVVDLVRFLVDCKELPEKAAVAQVWAAFTDEIMPHLYLLRERDYAEPFPGDFPFCAGLPFVNLNASPQPLAYGLSGLLSLAAGDDLGELAAHVEAVAKGEELSFLQDSAGPLGLECGTLLHRLALTMDKAHALFLWGSAAAGEAGDSATAEPTDWPSLVAYRNDPANTGKPWTDAEYDILWRHEQAEKARGAKGVRKAMAKALDVVEQRIGQLIAKSPAKQAADTMAKPGRGARAA